MLKVKQYSLDDDNLFMTHAQAVRLVQNHEHTLNILFKIVLAGLQVLLSSAKSINCLENRNVSHPISLGFNNFEAIELINTIVN